MLPMSERELAVLRLLGRLGMVMGQTIRALICPDQHAASCRRMLRGLVERKLLWHANVPNANAEGRLQGRTPRVYGLTDDGRQLLDTFGAEPHDGTFERLISRSKQAPTPPSASQLFTETYISDWCASLLDQVRRTPMLAGVHMQRRYVITDANGALLQTIGAVIILAFDPELKKFDRAGWVIPWLTDGAIAPSWRVVRLALEVDTGVASMRSIFEMAQTYARLSGDGTYQRLLGGAPRPVIVTPPARRARAVADVWMGAWEGSPALLSSIERTCHPEYGVLWGEYLALKANPVIKTSLLGSLLGTVEQWPAKIAAWPGGAPAAGSNVSQVTNKKPGSTSASA
ncbi:replication-relaxation family protein [Chloroflexus sp.]|uniref:replication-relaxation family protein n=1 Tax=Chloroflexus sp. TaxID=1904827 RepID=UPI002ACD9DA7|nr:replication-relaxation family protein [Chloroflexus sp.]